LFKSTSKNRINFILYNLEKVINFLYEKKNHTSNKILILLKRKKSTVVLTVMY